jgi:hypothetical protein
MILLKFSALKAEKTSVMAVVVVVVIYLVGGSSVVIGSWL